MKRYCFLIMAVASVLLVGCDAAEGPDVADVNGYIKMDGEPLANAKVQFVPQDAAVGRPSWGKTDAEGYYALQYSSSKSGAMLGEHIVRISTGGSAEEDEYGNLVSGPSPETVPAKYNVKSTLSRTVDPGENEINFELDSEGEIIDPLDDPQSGIEAFPEYGDDELENESG